MPSLGLLLALGLVAACGQSVALDGDVHRPHGEAALGVFGTDDRGDRVRGAAVLNDADCAVVGGLCLSPEPRGEHCLRDDGPVDVIVDDGGVLDTVCYPGDERGEVLVVNSDTAGSMAIALEDIAQRDNGTTVVFDGDAVFDVSIDANNVAFYGAGPDRTVIDGDVVVDGNNVRLRGLHITGDLILLKNNAAVVLTSVDGSVRAAGNNAALVEVLVAGDLDVEGNNGRFVNVEVDGAVALGRNATCVGDDLVGCGG